MYLAERGQTVEHNGQAYLVLEKGSVQRKEPNSRDSSIVAFERYAVDLSAFNQEGGDVVYKPRERARPELLFPDETELYYQVQGGRFRAELHDRLSAWLYPARHDDDRLRGAGRPAHDPPGPRRGHRGRGRGVVLRIAGFAASSAAVRSPPGRSAIYAHAADGDRRRLLLILQGASARRSRRAERLGRDRCAPRAQVLGRPEPC